MISRWIGLFVAAGVAFGEWDRFRGPNGAGVADGYALPAEFDETRNVIWKTALPEGLSSPVVKGGLIFLTGQDREDLITICVEAATGKIQWRRPVKRQRSEKLHKLNHSAAASVAVDDKAVYVFFPDLGLISYGRDGDERWRVPLGPFNNVYGMGASPVVAGGLLVLVCDQSSGSFIAAFEAASGKLRWRVARPEALSGHSTPIVAGTWVIAPGSFRMDAYDIQTGKVAWTAQGLPSEMKSVPVVDGDMVFIHGFNTPENDPGRLMAIPTYAEALASHDADRNGKIAKTEAPTKHVASNFDYVDLDRDGQLNEAEWNQYRRTMQAENALLAFRLGGELVWKFQRSVPQLPSPLVYRDVVYMVNESGILTTLDRATGKLFKQARVRGEADRYYASPVAGDGKVYIASHTGTVTVLKAGPEQEVLAINRLDGEILATPALESGRIYLRTRGMLYCFAMPPAK
jgi:outer membrane protein assembly factor BamB